MIIEDDITDQILNQHNQYCEVAKTILYFHLLNSKIDIKKTPSLIKILYVSFAFINSLIFNISLFKSTEKKHRLIIIEKQKHRQMSILRDYVPTQLLKCQFIILCAVRIILAIRRLNRSVDVLELVTNLNYIASDCIRAKISIVVEGDTPFQKALFLTRRRHERVVLVQWGSLTNSCIKYPFRNLLGVSAFLFTDKTFVHAINQKQIAINQNCKFLKIISDDVTIEPPPHTNTVIVIDQGIGGFIDPELNNQFYSDLKIISQHFPNLELFVRPHPSNSSTHFPIYSSDNRMPITHDFKKAQVAISIASSGLLDALYCGVIPVSYYPYPIEYDLSLNLSTSSFNCHPNGINKLILLLEKLVNASSKEKEAHLTTVYGRYF